MMNTGGLLRYSPWLLLIVWVPCCYPMTPRPSNGRQRSYLGRLCAIEGVDGSIILGLAGMFLAGTAVAQESPPTCHGLNFEQCHLAPGCEWNLVMMRPPEASSRVCIPMCVKKRVIRVIRREASARVIKLAPRGLIP